jgi:hypothetical protein
MKNAFSFGKTFSLATSYKMKIFVFENRYCEKDKGRKTLFIFL